MKRLITRVSRAFPTKAASERIAIWVTMVLSIAGIFWAIQSFRLGAQSERAKATFEIYLDNIANKPSNTLFRCRAPSDCDNTPKYSAIFQCLAMVDVGILEAFQGISAQEYCEGRSVAETAQEWHKHSSNEPLRTKVRKRLIEFRASSLAIDRSAAQERLAMLTAFVVCMEKRHCDEDIGMALIEKALVGFLNDSCVFVQSGELSWRRETINLAQYVLNLKNGQIGNYSDDENQKNMFLCDYLRELRPNQYFFRGEPR